ncbi:MAG: DnaD domain protein [Erysipelotrichaceae bacterium]|nr:DnaD domain protein [Erysipelotrichaceae bacterium]MDD4642511.1 DnaD domain protein [Erysipelotrichaceae bacterium]
MELFEQDTFQCLNDETNDNSQMGLLFLLYQPLIGNEAVALYGTLLNHGKLTTEKLSHARLCKLLMMNIETIERARVKLEQYNLLKVYFNQQTSEYIYQLLKPLNAKSFLNHYVFGIQYKQRLGLTDYEISKEMFDHDSIDQSGFSEITARFDQSSLDRISNKDVEEFISIKANQIKNDPNMGFIKGFDYQGFVKGLSELAFPRRLRTNENMRLIAQLSVIYGISTQRMRVLACRSINVKEQIFDQSALINRVRKEQPSYDHSQSDGYDLPPIVFLQNKQPNMPISLSAKKTLEYLVNDTPLTTNVINYLIEYVLDNTNNILNQKYVEKVAETFVRSKIEDIDQAKDLIKRLSRQTKNDELRDQEIKRTKATIKKMDNGDIELLKKQIKDKVDRMK